MGRSEGRERMRIHWGKVVAGQWKGRRKGRFKDGEEWLPEQHAHVPVEDRQQHRQGSHDGEGEDSQAFNKENLSVMRREVLIGRRCLWGGGDGGVGGRRKGRRSRSRHGLTAKRSPRQSLVLPTPP